MRERMQVTGWGSRVGAYLIDAVCAGLLAFAAYLAVGLLTGANFDSGNGEDDAWAVVALFTVIVNYSPLLCARRGKRSGQTFGRQLAGTRAVRKDGTRLRYGRALARHLAHLVLTYIPFVGLLNHLWPLWDGLGQTLHDKIAGTLVVDSGYVPGGVTPGPPVFAGLPSAGAPFAPLPADAPERMPGAWQPPAGAAACGAAITPFTVAPASAQQASAGPSSGGRRIGPMIAVGAVCALLAGGGVWLLAGLTGGTSAGSASAGAPEGTSAPAETVAPVSTARPHRKPRVREHPRLDLYKLVRRLRAAGDIRTFKPVRPKPGYQAQYVLDDGVAIVSQKVVKGGRDELLYEYEKGVGIDTAIEREAAKLGFGGFHDPR